MGMLYAFFTVSSVFSGQGICSKGATTINSTKNYAYGGNIGWINWTGDTNSGAVIGSKPISTRTRVLSVLETLPGLDHKPPR
jgi:hypothetical protein